METATTEKTTATMTDAELRAWSEQAQTRHRGTPEKASIQPLRSGLNKIVSEKQRQEMENKPAWAKARRQILSTECPCPFTCPDCGETRDYNALFEPSEARPEVPYFRDACECERIIDAEHAAQRQEEERKRFDDARRARIATNRENCGFVGKQWNRTFEAFDPTRDKDAGAAYRAVKAWAETFKKGETERGFVLTSPNYGCGKSHLAIAAGIVLLNAGHSVKYISLAKWLSEQRAEFFKARKYDSGDTEGVGRVGSAMRSALNADLLIIDDMGAEQIRTGEEGDWARQQIFTLLDDRANFGRPVIVTTNLDEAGISERIGGDHGGRCVSRLFQIATWRQMDGPDGRTPGW